MNLRDRHGRCYYTAVEHFVNTRLQPAVHAVDADIIRPHDAAVVHARRAELVRVEARQAVADIEAVLHDVVGRWEAPRALPIEALLADVHARDGDQVEILRDGSLVHALRHHRRLEIAGHIAAVQQAGACHQLDDAVHLPRRADIAGTDARDAERCDLRLLHDAAKSDVRGDNKLAPRIRAVQVLRRVDLGVAERLRLTQGIFKFQAGRRHGVEDIIRRAVHNTADAEHRFHIERALQIRQPADAAADGR